MLFNVGEGMEARLISIVIPVYNQNSARFERCINSIVKQSYEKFEVIVVDDGSTKEILSLISAICARDSRISLISQQNSGAGVARNLGVQKAKGEFVLFVDSDDMLSDYALEDALQCLNQTRADMVVGQVHKEKETEWKNKLAEREDRECLLLDKEEEITEYINHIMGYQNKRFLLPDRYFCDGPVAKLCKRKILIQSPFGTEKFWGEDTIWNLKFTKQCKKIAISKNVWYYAFANEDSQTHVFRPECEYEFKYRIRQEKDFISVFWPDCIEGLYAQIWISTYYIFACYLLHRDNKESFGRKYKVFLNCIKQPVYREMLKGISFKDEEIFFKRFIKKSIRIFSLYGPKALAYLGWKITLSLKKGER